MNELTLKNIEKLIRGSEKRIARQNQEYVGQAVNAILNGVQSMFDERDVKINKLESGLNEVKKDIKFLHQDIRDIEAEMSDKPSKRQFEDFKSKFDNFVNV